MEEAILLNYSFLTLLSFSLVSFYEGYCVNKHIYFIRSTLRARDRQQ